MIGYFHGKPCAAVTACALIAVFAFTAPPASAAPKAAAKKDATTEVARPAGERVEYTDLAHHVGAELVVETTLNTVRRGTLIKYTNPSLTLQLGAEAGSIELSVPRETVRSVRVLAPAKTDHAE